MERHLQARPRRAAGAAAATIAVGYTTIMAESETQDCITEHERILQEIESTDTVCVGPTLR